jgi:hypothetical protein
MDRIQNVGDKMSWLGLGLILVGAVAWVNRRQDEQEANKRVGSDGGPAPSSSESK